MAEAAQAPGESQSAEVKRPQPAGKALRPPQRRGPRSMLRVSQLLLGAIASHRGLSLAALEKALGNAGYQVRRKNSPPSPSGEAAPPQGKSTLLRVSGSDAACFRVWKTPKPKKRPELGEGSRAWRKPPARPRGPRRRRPRREAARKARQLWRRSARADARAKRARPQTERQGRPGTRAAAAERSEPRTREKRPGAKPRAEKDAEKLVKRTVPKPTPLKTEGTCSEPGKTSDPRAACAKAAAKSECSRNATENS
ncbi:testis-specific H1 histone-like [Dasypus novemcinctus]|uniref:testis-specific H1 histone-like n=1 Tax=Dasypus novemcinctus TaxID=9361 RepID=UPI0003289ACF|nr:testis-specific H1 histone-like [Dasypus novemcinctus]